MLDVYKSFYKFNGEPFRLSPDHRFSYVHSSYANARAYLEYAISQGEGFIAITGEPGAGKTTLINGLLAELDKTRINVATLKNLQLDPDNLIGMVVNEFGLRVGNKSKSSLLLDLERFLKNQILRGQRAVLIIDEAQGLSPASLEELRLLSNLQYDNCLLLQVFLVGQEKLMDMIRSPDMEHLRQRLIASSHLDRLGLEETVAYIEHRLCYVGWQGDPAINEDAIRLIHISSLGVPRRINLICHRLFLYGGLNQKHRLVGADIRQVVGELNGESVLASDLPAEDSRRVTEPEGDSTPDLSLPRASSCPHIEERSQTPSSPPVQEECSDHTPARETGLEQGRADIGSPLVPGEPVPVSWPGKYRWGIVVTVLLAGLLLVPVIETKIKYHQLNSISAALVEDGKHSLAAEPGEIELTEYMTASAYNSLDRNISAIETSGAIERYTSSVTVASESVNVLQTDIKRSRIGDRDTQITDDSNEQQFRPDDRDVMTPDSGTNRRPLQEIERKSARLTSDDLEPVDGQVVMVAARIEAEHRRLRNEAEQRFKRQLLKEGGRAGLPAAN